MKRRGLFARGVMLALLGMTAFACGIQDAFEDRTDEAIIEEGATPGAEAASIVVEGEPPEPGEIVLVAGDLTWEEGNGNVYEFELHSGVAEIDAYGNLRIVLSTVENDDFYRFQHLSDTSETVRIKWDIEPPPTEPGDYLIEDLSRTRYDLENSSPSSTTWSTSGGVTVHEIALSPEDGATPTLLDASFDLPVTTWDGEPMGPRFSGRFRFEGFQGGDAVDMATDEEPPAQTSAGEEAEAAGDEAEAAGEETEAAGDEDEADEAEEEEPAPVVRRTTRRRRRSRRIALTVPTGAVYDGRQFHTDPDRFGLSEGTSKASRPARDELSIGR